MLLWLAGGVVVLVFFGWMGRLEQEETGIGWARAGLRYMLWTALLGGGLLVAVWAWEGLSKTH